MLPELSLVFLLGSTWLGTMLAEDPAFEFQESPAHFAVMGPDVSGHNSFSGASEAEGAGRLGKEGPRASTRLVSPGTSSGLMGKLVLCLCPVGEKKHTKKLAPGRQPLEMISVAFLRKFTFPLTLFLIFSFKTGVHLRRAWACKIPETQERVPGRFYRRLGKPIDFCLFV